MLCVFVLLLELSKSEVVEEAFEQKLDHANHRDSETFTQYFYYDLQYASDNWSSIVFEIPDLMRVSRLHEPFSDSATEIAKRSQSALVTFDLRYFGKSWPSQFTNATKEAFRYLSISQILGDIASFVHSRAGGRGSRTFVVGGGYGGNLAAWVSLKYPQYIVGSWSSSAPIYIHIEDKGFDNVFLSKLHRYDQGSSVCYFRLADVLKAVNRSICMSTSESERSKMLEMLGLAKETTNASAMYILYQGLAMMDGQNDETMFLDLLCDRGFDVEHFALYLRYAFEWYKIGAQDLDPELIMGDQLSENVRDMKSFWKLKCYELCQFPVVGTSGMYTYFRSPIFWNSSYYEDVCNRAFGSKVGDITVTNAQYGGQDPGGKAAIFSLSQDDVAQQFMVRRNKTGNSIIILNSTERSSPYADLRNYKPGEDPKLTESRETAISTAVDWLTNKCEKSCVNGNCVAYQCVCSPGYAGEWCDSVEIRMSKIRAISITATAVPTLLLLCAALIAWRMILKEPEDAAVIHFLR